MANKNSTKVRGITIELGGDADPLNNALKDVNKQLYSTQSELKDIERLLKLDPSNVTLLEQKQRKLAESIEGTTEKLEGLRQAEKYVQQQMAEGKDVQKQYDALQREIAATENSLQSLRREAATVDKALDDVDERPVEEVADAAKKAARELDDAGKEAVDFGDILKAELVVDGIGAIASGIGDIVEETKEYRKIMGSLDVSSKQAGYSAEETAESYKYLYGVLGDDQTAATTTANLQALQLDQIRLKTLIDGMIGSWAKYGDSIPIDGLAESINETVRAGQVTGTFADVLNWGSKEGETFGVMLKANTKANEDWNKAVEDAETAEDFFNLALQECATQAERVDLVMKAMSDQSLPDAGRAWRKNNEELVASNEAQAQFTETAARLAETVSPAVNAVQEGFNSLFETVTDLTENVDFEQVADQIDQIFEIVSGVIDYLIQNGETVVAVLITIGAALTALKLGSIIGTLTGAETLIAGITQLLPTFGAALSLLSPLFSTLGTIAKGAWDIIAAHPFVAIIAAVALFGDEIQAILQKVDDFMQNVFAADWSQVFGPIMGDAMNKLRDNLKLLWDDGMQILNGIIDFVRGVFTADWERAWVGVYNIFEGIFNGVFDLAKTIVDSVWGLIRGVWNGLQDLLRGGKAAKPKQSPSAINSGRSVPMMANGGILNYGSAIVGEAGPELLTVNSGRAVVTPLTGDKAGNVSGSGYGSYVDNRQYHFTVSSLSEFVKIQERMEFERQSLRMGYAKP